MRRKLLLTGLIPFLTAYVVLLSRPGARFSELALDLAAQPRNIVSVDYRETSTLC